MTMSKISLLFVCLLLSTVLLAQDDVPGPPGGDNTPTVTIGGLMYKLNKQKLSAMVANGNKWEGELVIPEQVTHEGETYTVDRIEWCGFQYCTTLTKVWIPKTVTDIVHYALWDECKNPFYGCTSLESIEVDEANPSMCSVDGVLFSKDRTRLYCYPAGARNESYTVPQSVTWLGMDAFARNAYLLSVEVPNSVTFISAGTFSGCRNLNAVKLSKNIRHIAAYTFENCNNLRFLDIPESVTSFGEGVFRWSPLDMILIRGTFPEGLRDDTFYFMSESTVIYVQASEVSKFKSVFQGTVLSLEDYTNGITTLAVESDQEPLYYDLQGRRLSEKPQHGLYIKNGKKVQAK